jgi:hypothetical protein
MNAKPDWFEKLVGAEFFSPKDFVRHAVLIVVLFAVAHAFGLREYTTIISGTMASPTLGVETCALLAMIYLVFYFGAAVLAPILVIAAGLLLVWEKVKDSSRRLLP